MKYLNDKVDIIDIILNLKDHDIFYLFKYTKQIFDYTREEIIKMSKLDRQQKFQIRLGIATGVEKSFIMRLVEENFNSKQLYQIVYGIQNGLEMDEIKYYARKHISAQHMAYLRSSFRTGIIKLVGNTIKKNKR